eukprot:scaffold52509_cov59-Phaeocystis_antarctica.AAC.2
MSRSRQTTSVHPRSRCGLKSSPLRLSAQQPQTMTAAGSLLHVRVQPSRGRSRSRSRRGAGAGVPSATNPTELRKMRERIARLWAP